MHAPTPFPPRGIRIQKKVSIAPMLKFPSAKITKIMNMLCKHGTNNVKILKIKMKCVLTNQMQAC